ncbi:hypothetical protein G6045_27460 [Streptomyces sp. YC504]|uniref:Uncharacterized protein n=1 Tax=Streptomyces mesophilus TaxID=1775132 RepID=A0A6G4XRN3_9ACTN|nr:hypothetical protein [Streptomyces mesophilus]NGO79364.1 hypothetical protein [Streptomyces mesophilus]
MKLRHARAVAVFALVVVALTGARRGGDGGCDDDHDSSGSSGGSGGGVDVVETTIPPLPTDTAGVPTYEAPTTAPPARKGKVTPVKGEVRIVDCVVEKPVDSTGIITFKYEVTNGNSDMAANYVGRLMSVDPDGTLRANGQVVQYQIEPGGSWQGESKGSYGIGPGVKAPSAKSCKVGEVTKTNVPATG